MTCAACGFENEAGLKFCNECGTPLARACPNGHPNLPAAKFCGECGAALGETTAGSPAPAPAVRAPAERRFISALFADLVGFTSMTEASDAEDVRAMLTVYFERARAVIERFGGEVDKFIGDAITAFWGTTVSNEDDAERAVRAGLELVDLVDSLGEELGLDLALRVGVLSGETAVGEGGNQHGLVIGDIVNTAARIQSAAEPGTVYVGDATHHLTADAFVYTDVGVVEAKGKAEPVRVWRADSVVGQRGGQGRWATVEPPFVGREDELRFLKDQLHATSRDGAARLVSIVGEPGIGKSRIAWELLKYVDGVTEVFKWHQGRSPAYGEGVTFWALAEMVRSRAGISDEDQPGAARIRLRTSVAEFVPDPDEQAWIEPKLAGLLGLAESGDVSRGELFSAIRTFFQRIAAVDTVVMLFEDLHWADAGQLEFIEELVELSRSSPILVITLARPDLIDRRSDWGTAHSHFSSLHLGAMSDVEMVRLVRGVVPDADDGLVDAIVARAGGVPLYAVEFLRALVDTGSLVADGATLRTAGPVDDVGLPASLHAVVGSRLDRLDPDDRALVQDCAILGQSFTIEGLEALTGRTMDELTPRLRELTRRELLRLESDPFSPERGQYQFVQGVIREVAYGRIAKAERVARHVRVAEYFQDVVPVEGAAVIADHYLKAYEIEPDETLADRARTALVRAVERASDLASFTQALSLAKLGLGVPGPGRDRLRLWDLGSRAASAVLDHTEAIGLADEAVAWARSGAEPDELLLATHLLGRALVSADRPGDAVAVLEPAFDPARVDEPRMAALGSMLAGACMRAARWQMAADVAVPVIVAAERSGDQATLVDALATRGTVLPSLGRHHEGAGLLRESLRLAGDSFSGLRAINNLLLFEVRDGLQAVADLVDRGVDLARRVGEASLSMRLARWAAWLGEKRGDFPSAVAALEAVDASDGGYWEAAQAAFRERLLWHVDADDGRLRRAQALLEPLLESPEPQYRDTAGDELVHVYWYLGDLEAAWEQVERLAVGGDSGLTSWGLQFRDRGLAIVLRSGDLDRHRVVAGAISDRGKARDSWMELVGLVGRVLSGDEIVRAEIHHALDAVAATHGPSERALWGAEFARALDGRGPAADLAAEAYAWFAAAGDRGSLDYYADLFADLVPDAAAG